MELVNNTIEVVEPEVRAYVSSLVTALGGSSADEDGRYVLGDDALACLRDVRRWLKLYDEKFNRLDVARCLAELNLVNGDLLQILASWPENATDDTIKLKISLACIELLVPLTWPLGSDGPDMTVNHHRHIPYLELAQLGYKRSIINFDGARILHTAVRVALPSMAEPQGERSTRDTSIIKLVLFFLRNVAIIAPPPGVEYEGDEAEISRSATIGAFDYQDIFHLLLTISSTIGEDFSQEDVIVMEIIFHIIKGISVEKLFMSESQLDNSRVDELVGLRSQEAGMNRSYLRTAPTRHNRFGTMIWIKRGEEKVSTVSGQDALIDGARSLAKMDKYKKFKPARRPTKIEKGPLDFDTPVSLNHQANNYLRNFVEEFLDSGFNPLFLHIRKAIDREAERILGSHQRQFFYLISWFLEAERMRRQSKNLRKKAGVSQEINSFALVASVLNQEMFITLNRAMETSYDSKAWQDLNAAMKCFTQILLTVQEMYGSELEEDREIAENIMSRIFYEEATHDRVANIVRYYKDQSFGYLNSCTELAHVYLRLLEHYSKQNAELQVRSRRRTKKRTAKRDEGDNYNEMDESDGEDDASIQRTSTERKFDFRRFASRFLSQGCIDTFAKFCAFYNDLSPEQLKRVHRFFYRIAFKMDMSVMLFRVDIISLLYNMIKGPEGLDPKSPVFKEWDELVRQLIKRCIRKIQERPELIIEMLFSKTQSTAHYLEYGYEKQTITTKPRPAAELEVKPGMGWEEQVGVAVSALLDRNEGYHLAWLKCQLSSAEIERRSWEQANTVMESVENEAAMEIREPPTQLQNAPPIVVKPDSIPCKVAMFKNGYLRLLMTLIGLQQINIHEEVDTDWEIPYALTAERLQQLQNLIKKFEFSPPVFDDGQEAENFIRRKSAGSSAKRAAFHNDDGIVESDEEEYLFPAGGPTARRSDALERLKKTRRRRRKSDSGDEDEPSIAEERSQQRAAERKARELEKQRKIKSELFVHESDDEIDEEKDRIFFEQEEKIRQRQKIAAMKELLGTKRSETKENTEHGSINIRRKRRAVSISSGDEDESRSDSENEGDTSAREGPETDTPLSSPRLRSSQTKRVRLSGEGEQSQQESPAKDINGEEMDIFNVGGGSVHSENEDESAPVRTTTRARRQMAGFLIDSSDDE